MGGQALIWQADVSDRDAVAEMIAGTVKHFGRLDVAVANAAINHLARTMARELAQHRIKVNVVNPGWIDTPGERKYFSEEESQVAGKRIPGGGSASQRTLARQLLI